ncbi:MAG: hypothetical protein ACLUOO_13285 [Coprococcus sp.]
MSNDLSELRDKLLAKRALQARALEEAKSSVEEFKKIQSSLTEEQISALEKYGIDVRFLQNVQSDRLLTDTNYLASVKEQVIAVVSTLQQEVERVLCTN